MFDCIARRGSVSAIGMFAFGIGAVGCSSSRDPFSRHPAGDVADCGPASAAPPTLFYLDPGRATVGSVRADGSNPKTLVAGQTGIPDGIAVDRVARKIYWTVMGAPSENDGSIQSANLDGTGVQAIVPSGGTFTPKQLKIDPLHGKLYWSDREGMRVLRANLDGTSIEPLVITGATEADRADDTNWCVGIALDLERGQLYWTQKGPYTSPGGSIRRASLQIPPGQTAAARTDIEVLFSGLVSPIDLDLDLRARKMYWTSNGDMTVSRAPMDPPSGYDPAARTDREVIVEHADQAVGIALDLPHARVFFAGFFGIDGAGLDGSGRTPVLPMTNELMTGLALSYIAD